MQRNFLQRVGVHVQSTWLALGYMACRPRPLPAREYVAKPVLPPNAGKIELGAAFLFGGMAWGFPLLIFGGLAWDAFITETIHALEAKMGMIAATMAMWFFGILGASVCSFVSKAEQALHPRAWRVARFLCFHWFTVAFGVMAVVKVLSKLL